MLKTLQKRIGKKIKLRKKNGGYIIVDFREDMIRLPSGLIIPKNRILHIDTEKKIIVYLDENNMVREEKYV